MVARVLDGRAVAARVRAGLAGDVERLAAAGRRPTLTAVLVGDDEASHIYVGSKQRAAAASGIDARKLAMPASAGQKEVLRAVDELNADPAVNGIIVQLLRQERVPVEGSHVVIVGRGLLVGRPLAVLLSAKAPGANATVTLCHTGTLGLPGHTRSADVLVAAAGRAAMITPEMVKPGAAVVDVGNHRVGGRIVGDVAPEVAEVAGALTPVPGGVGPMTVAMLLANTVTAAREQAG